MEEAKTKPPKDEKSPPDTLGGLGLTLDLDDCYNEFAERAKVLPFVRPEKVPE